MEQIEFEHHVPRLRRKLVRYASQYLPNEAEDVVQETLLKLWQLRQRINDAEHMQRLAMIVVRNASISELRRRKTANAISLESLTPKQVGADDIHRKMEVQETEVWLNHSIRRLPDKQRAILEMRNVEQLSYADIARIIGLTESSVRGLICRARNSLLQQLKSRENGTD